VKEKGSGVLFFVIKPDHKITIKVWLVLTIDDERNT
jgi:hypothetical protein